jgi:hypothetical protein
MIRTLMAGLPVAAVAIVLSISVAPAGATPNNRPIAVSGKATDVGHTQAWVNGTAGPNVQNGDITTYYFQYGTTKSYGKRTSSGTVGSCPPGVTNPLYCTVPASKSVSALIRGLSPNVSYHYRLVATNPDGTSYGADKSFTTKAIPPIKYVTVPRKVDVGKSFKIFVHMRAPATVTIKFNGSTYSEGSIPHKVTQKVSAPTTTGTYTVTVKAVGDETQTITTSVKVVNP